MLPYRISKSLFRKIPRVHYRCQKCGTSLVSTLVKAGDSDTCPECGEQFIVPGEKEKGIEDSTVPTKTSHFEQKMSVTCPSCAARLKIPSNARGKKARCPGCNTTFEANNESIKPPPETLISPSDPESRESVCVCDSCARCDPLTEDEVFAISPYGGIPSDPSPSARGNGKVYMILCKKKFIKLFEGHGNTATDDAINRSHEIARRHLQLKGKIQ